MNRRSRVQRTLAVFLLVTGAALPRVHGSPGDVVTTHAPALEGAAPEPKDVATGDYDVAETGAATYAYKIVVPPGRRGMAPELALTYNSQGALRGGIAAGWTMHVPSIEVSWPEGTLAAPVYVSSMAGGQRLVEVADPGADPPYTATFRAERDGTFTRYERNPNGSWVVRLTNGTTMYFGEGTASDNDSPGERTRWMLSRVVDSVGNTITYTWNREWELQQGVNIIVDLTLAKIEYTSNAAAGIGAHAVVDFVYFYNPELCSGSSVPVGARVDYHGGRKRIFGSKRLTEVKSSVRSTPGGALTLRRKLTLSYDTTALSCSQVAAPLRLLTSLQETAWAPDGTSTTLPAVQLGYGPMMPLLGTPDATKVTAYGSVLDDLGKGHREPPDVGASWAGVNEMLIDLDGDGRPDHVYIADPTACRVVWDRNTGSGFVYGGEFYLPTIPFASLGELQNLYPVELRDEQKCSLTAQLTFRSNKTPSAIPPTYGSCFDCAVDQYCDPTGGLPYCGPLQTCEQCWGCPGMDPPDPIGTYNAYRFMDLNGDSRPELISAIAYDPFYYDPNLEQIYPVAPPLCENAPIPAQCLDRYNNPTACGAWRMRPLPGPECPTELKKYDYRRQLRKCDGYVWQIFWNQGGSNPYSEPSEFRYSPVPLESNGADSTLGGASHGYSGLMHGFHDVDGDGIIDALLTCYDTGANCIGGLDENGNHLFDGRYQVFKGNGDGYFVGDSNGVAIEWTLPVSGPLSWPGGEGSGNDRYLYNYADLFDFNGDGLPDYSRAQLGQQGGTVYLYPNSGVGFIGPGIALTPLPASATKSHVHVTAGSWGGIVIAATRVFQRRPLDLDGDGLVDTHDYSVATGIFTTLRNVGDMVVAASQGLDGDWNDALKRQVDIAADTWTVEDDLLDLDGDGLLDRVETGPFTFHTENPATPAPRLLRTINNGQGRVVTFNYASSSSDVVDQGGESRIPSPTWVVSTVLVTHAHGPAANTTVYRYSNPVFNKDPYGHWGFRGFETVYELRQLESITEERYNYSLDFSGRMETAVTYLSAADDSVLSIVDNHWVEIPLFGGAVRSFQIDLTTSYTCSGSETETACRAAGALRRMTTTWETHPAQVTYAKEVVDSKSASTVLPGDRREVAEAVTVTSTATTYRVDGDETIRYEADAASAWVMRGRERTTFNTWGLPLTVARWTNDTTALTERFTYDGSPGTGQVTRWESPRRVATGAGPQMDFGYDAFKLYPTTRTNALAQTVTEETDFATGALTRRIHPRFKLYCPFFCYFYYPEDQYKIDGFGRVREHWQSFDSGSAYVLKLVEKATFYDSESPTRVRTETLLDEPTAKWITVDTTYDGSGRTLKVTTERFSDGDDEVVEYGYDAEGRLTTVTRPDPSSNSASVKVTYTIAVDSVGRPTELTGPGGLDSEVTYGRLTQERKEITADDSGARTETTLDVFGRMVQVREYRGGAAWATATYLYDDGDRLAQMTDADGAVTVLRHDWLGRRTGIIRGTREWAYAYDENGNLISATIPFTSGLASEYTSTTAYDALDRPISHIPGRRYASDTELKRLGIGETKWAYDQTWSAIGALTGVTQYSGLPGASATQVATASFTYEARLLLAAETRSFWVYPVSGVASTITDTRTVTYSYKPNGLPYEQVHVDGTKIRYDYDRRGLPISAVRVLTNGSTQNLASLTRNVAGLVTVRGTGFNQSRYVGYDQLGRPTADYVWGNGAYRGTYFTIYNTIGEATGLVTNRVSFQFRYDNQHQLIEATGTNVASPYNIVYGFSDAGPDFFYTPGGKLTRARVQTTLAGAAPTDWDRDVDYTYWVHDPHAPSLLRDHNPPYNLYASFGRSIDGNLASRWTSSHSETFLYDGDDQQRQVDGTYGKELYRYNENRQRNLAIKLTGTGTGVRWWFGDDELQYNLSGGAAHTVYSHVAAGGQPLARLKNAGADIELHYHGLRGDLLLALDSVGNVRSEFTYGPWGEILRIDGPAAQAPLHTRRFNNKEHDTASALVYYGYRYFDPVALQWSQADPLYRLLPELAVDEPRRTSLYMFTGNNPVRFVDPDGLTQDEGSECPRSGCKEEDSEEERKEKEERHQKDVQEASEQEGPWDPGPVPKSHQIEMQEAGINPRAVIAAVSVAGARLFASASLRAAQGVMLARLLGRHGEQKLQQLFSGGQRHFRMATRFGDRIVDNLWKGIAQEAKVGYTYMTEFVKGQVAKDAYLLENGFVKGVQWHFFPGPNGVGPSKPLESLLKSQGIDIVIH